nr:hypothetical protein [Deltaproteobacteria bacterium]
MKRWYCFMALVAFVIAGGADWITPRMVHAESFYQGKTITMILGTSPGGRRDRISRTTAKYLRKYIPGNPNILIQNIPGGKGIPAQMKFSRSKNDGTVMATVVSSDMEAPYFGAPGAKYNPREYVWIGAVGTGKQRNVLFTHKQAGFNTLEDLKSRTVALGSQGVGHRSYIYGRVIAEVLDLKIRWVLGYSTPELYIAIERGELDGRVNDAASAKRDRPDWFIKEQIVPHVAMALPEYLPPTDDPFIANVPSIFQFAKTELHRDIIRKFNTTDRLGGAFALPPGAPDSARRILEQAVLKL